MKIYKIKPVPKPRMSRQDAWRKRDCVVRYWNFKAHCKLLDFKLPDEAFHIHFILPMPDSWSKKKRAEMLGKPHKQKPDIDNMLKAVFDAIYDTDEHINDCRVSKWWGEEPCIIVQEIGLSVNPLFVK